MNPNQSTATMSRRMPPDPVISISLGYLLVLLSSAIFWRV
jgi:hypothetical protein